MMRSMKTKSPKAGMTLSEQAELAHTVSSRKWKKDGEGYDTREHFGHAVMTEFLRNGYTPFPAEYDSGGNCKTCGEAGRCPGWHVEQPDDGTAGQDRDNYTDEQDRKSYTVQQ